MAAQKSRTTIQDIAKALGVSRNTVSKALNHHADVPEDTRARVLAKAQELNYKSLGDVQSLRPVTRQDILVICKEKQLSSSTFFFSLVQALIAEIRARGATPIAQFTSLNESEQETVSPAAQNVAGIIATGTLSVHHITQLLDTGKPLVFFDYYHDPTFDPRPCDIVNSDAVPLRGVIQRMYEQGARSFGFIGDLRHCFGFGERYAAFRGMVDALPVRSGPEFDLPAVYTRDDLKDATLADAYICANDYLALPFLQVLLGMGKKVPQDIQVCGFDGIPESDKSSPSLTSIRVSTEDIAGNMVAMLFDRIAHPDRKKRILHVGTDIVFHNSVR